MASEYLKWKYRDVKSREGAGFWTEKSAPYPEGGQALWDTLTEGAAA